MLRPTDLPEPVVPAISKMGHLGEIGHHRLAADGLAECERERRARLFEIVARQKFAQVNGFARVVGKFDTDDVTPRYHRDTRGHRRHRARHVVCQRDHAGGFHAGCGLEFIKRHNGSGAHRIDAAAHAEIDQHGFPACGRFLPAHRRKACSGRSHARARSEGRARAVHIRRCKD